ncbi:MAG TPA: fluoride efflux transporter CrcB [Acidimicrobiales bacterium]|nr:fluoride efflux transporter CrcB [Acidimicrobiales bacterium]
MPWWEWLLVGAAGAVGAPLRYLVDTLVSARGAGEFPFGTMTVNLSGSFALGVLTGLVLYHGVGTAPNLVAGTGVLGAYTTFSTFSLETLSLAEAGEVKLAVRNAVISVFGGTLAAAAGWGLAAL